MLLLAAAFDGGAYFRLRRMPFLDDSQKRCRISYTNVEDAV